jgi:fluoroacetyl-CoA thioesterase
MKPDLAPGLTYTHCYTVPPEKVVRHIYPEAPEFQDFPDVFATGYMVALMEWACVKAMAPYLDEGEGSLGTHITVSHTAPTPPGLTITVTATLTRIEGRRLWWDVAAHDGIDEIGCGTHERAVIHKARFEEKLRAKRLA